MKRVTKKEIRQGKTVYLVAMTQESLWSRKIPEHFEAIKIRVLKNEWDDETTGKMGVTSVEFVRKHLDLINTNNTTLAFFSRRRAEALAKRLTREAAALWKQSSTSL